MNVTVCLYSTSNSYFERICFSLIYTYNVIALVCSAMLEGIICTSLFYVLSVPIICPGVEEEAVYSTG